MPSQRDADSDKPSGFQGERLASGAGLTAAGSSLGTVTSNNKQHVVYY